MCVIYRKFMHNKYSTIPCSKNLGQSLHHPHGHQYVVHSNIYVLQKAYAYTMAITIIIYLAPSISEGVRTATSRGL